MNKKEFLKKGLIYQVFSIGSQLINIVLIPIYAKNLTTQDFGQYNIISSILGLLSLVINLGIFSGLSRFYNEYEDKNRLKNIALSFSIIWGGFCVLVGMLLSPVLSKIIFNGDINGVKYLHFVFANSLILSIISIYSSYLSMQFKALKVSLISFSQIIIMVLLSIYFIVLNKDGVIGILKAQIWSTFIVMAVLLILDVKNIKIIVRKKELRYMLSFGLGLLPGNMSAWVLTLIDRYFLKVMVDLSTVGVYSMGYKIGMLIEPVFINPFRSIFNPYRYKVYKEKNGKLKMQNMYQYYNFICWFIMVGLSLFSNMAIMILANSNYKDSYKVVPIVLFSYYLYGLGSFYCFGFQVANKTIVDSVILIFAAIINVVFNFLLIPKMGMYGAAMATVIAYFFVNINYYYFGKKYYDMELNFFEPFKYLTIFILIYVIYFYLKEISSNVFFQFFLSSILCVIYLYLTIILKFIPYEKLKWLCKMFENKFSRLKVKGNKIISS